jgi:hypothetical protein
MIDEFGSESSVDQKVLIRILRLKMQHFFRQKNCVISDLIFV